MVMAPRWRKCSRMATASAAPSLGSVLAPISSSSTRSFGPATFAMASMLVTWAEKVLRFASIDCWSPMSASTRPNSGSFDFAGGHGNSRLRHQHRNAHALSGRRSLPPVLGPLMIINVFGG